MKKILILFLTVILCVSLFACKKDESEKDEETTENKKEEIVVNDGLSILIGDRRYYAYHNGKFHKDFPVEKVVEDGKTVLNLDYIMEDDVYISGYTEYKYEGDFLKEAISYDTMCELLYRREFEPDENGNNKVTRNYDENNELYQIIERDFIKVNDSKAESGFSYRESERREFDKDNKPTGRCVLEYYDTGVATPKKKTYYDGNGSLTYIYEYDEKEQYTKMYTYQNGKLVEVKDF